jgi:pimeloyl-ACP methyl ester carboxylesterase
MPRYVVLLHGQPGSRADWDGVVSRFPAELRPIVPDRPGYGSNRQAAGGFMTNGRAVIADLDVAGVERAVVVGHSYGGGAALAAALLAPKRVEALVLVASVGPGCLTEWDRLLAAPVVGPVCAVAAWWLTPVFVRALLALIERRRGPRASNELVGWDVWAHTRHDHGALWRTFLTEQRALVREVDHLVPDAAVIRVPTLVLADPRDMVVPIRTARELCALVPRARLELIEGAGHHLPRRAPQAVADAIVAIANSLRG